MKKEEIKYKIAYYEAERDRSLKIHCPRVAAKFQRMIDKLKKRRFHQKKTNKVNENGNHVRRHINKHH